MHKSDILSLKISGNAALGFMLQGYMLAYLNPALSTIDVVFNFDEESVNFYNGLLSGKKLKLFKISNYLCRCRYRILFSIISI